MFKPSFIGAFLLASLIATPLNAAPKMTEDQWIAELSSPKESKVTEALQKLEKEYPTSTKAFPKIKELLTDARPKVKRKAARVLGVLHAEVSEQDIQNICALLKSPITEEKIDGLKSLRGLTAPSAVPQIEPLLQDANPYVIRDACRTLAVLGNKDLVPKIEPLLQHSNPAVQKDAMDAIRTLKGKS